MQRWVRTVAATAGAMLALALAAGCTPTPEPTPTPTGFASDAEAFRAAEETYRAYVDALNQVDLADPKTFEPVFSWTTGAFNRAERMTLSRMAADRWQVGGETIVSRVDYLSTELPLGDATIGACVDVSTVTLVDSEGVSQVSEDRPDVQSTLITLTTSGDSPTGFLVASVEGTNLEPPC